MKPTSYRWFFTLLNLLLQLTSASNPHLERESQPGVELPVGTQIAAKGF